MDTKCRRCRHDFEVSSGHTQNSMLSAPRRRHRRSCDGDGPLTSPRRSSRGRAVGREHLCGSHLDARSTFMHPPVRAHERHASDLLSIQTSICRHAAFQESSTCVPPGARRSCWASPWRCLGWHKPLRRRCACNPT